MYPNSPQQLEKLFADFAKQRILIIGDVMIDAYLWGKVDRISPEAPVPVVSLKKRENRMGGAANVALNIQSMGATPLLCSVIGNDEKSHTFLQLMQQQGLVTDGILPSHERVTTTKFRIIGNNAQMLRVDEETEKNLSPQDSALLLEKIKNFLQKDKPGAIIFEDYDKGVITPWLIEKVVNLAREHNIPVAVDPKKKNFMNYHGVTLFKPNLKELREGLKLDEELNTEEAIAQAVTTLQEYLDVNITLTTLSEKGIYYNQKNRDGSYQAQLIPAHVRNISDVSGAGDTVISVTALCMACNVPINITARLANLAGGIVCEYVGVVPISREKLLQEATQTLNPNPKS